MQYRDLGDSGISASVVGLGTWAMGGWMWGGTDEAAAVAAIGAALDAGINLIDTAPAYGLGLSEELVGKAIAGRRDDVVIATKCGLVWHVQRGDYFFHEEGRPVHKFLGRESIRYEVEHSLRRLGTDRIDLYQTHWQDQSTPIADTMAELLALVDEGKILAIGVSNVTVDQLAEYRRYGSIANVQERYSMLDRGLEQGLLPACLAAGVAVLAYSPLASGLLTGKIGPDREFSGDDLRVSNPRFSRENRQRVAALLADLAPIAERHQVTLGQLVIAWTAAQPGLTHVLVGARNPDQARENAAAGGLILTADEVATITAAVDQHGAAIV